MTTWVSKSNARDKLLPAVLLAASALALGIAIQIRNGTLDPAALIFLTLGLVLVLAALFAQRLPQLDWLPELTEASVMFLIGLGLAFQLGLLIITQPGYYVPKFQPAIYLPFILGMLAAIVLAATWLWPAAWLRKARLPLMALIFLGLGIWMIVLTPYPTMDVFIVQHDSVQALLKGINPYSITYPNIFGRLHFYPPAYATPDRLNFGFIYPPLSLLLSIPGYLIGDLRYSQLAAILLSGLLMAYARPGPLGKAAAALFLFTPRVFLVIEESWTEPFAVLFLVLTVFLACRSSRWTPVALGLLLVIKQNMFFALPLALLLLPDDQYSWRDLLRFFAPALAVGALVSLPMALWNWADFWKSAIIVPFAHPFRPDALSYLAWVADLTGVQLSSAIGFLAAMIGVLLSLQFAPRTPAGFAAGMAVTYLLFFAFNRQAFCNYYYFVIGALCCATAAFNSTMTFHKRQALNE